MAKKKPAKSTRKKKSPATAMVPEAVIERKILLVRGEKVLLDSDLAELYQVETKALIQAVKRNIERFPDDFMFQLSKEEFEDWRSQIVTSNPGAKMGLRRPPYAFSSQSEMYLKWYADRMFLMVPAQSVVRAQLESLKEFPPARGSSLSISKVLESMTTGAKTGK